MGGSVIKRAGALAVVAVATVSFTSCGAGGSESADPTKTTSAGANNSSGGSDETTTTEEEQAVMPDLVGMTEDEARAALLDAGVKASDIEVTEQESLEAPGTVISQVPSADQPIASATLTVATSVGEVPDFTGKPIADVKDWAEERGIAVRETTVLDDALAEGEVISTTPKAGAKASSEIAVEVASKPIVGTLADVEPISRENCAEFDTGEADVNGEFIQDSLLVKPYRESDPCVIEYDFGRDWQQLKFTLGILDDSPTDSKVRIEVFGDDKELLNTVVSFAEAAEQKVDVTDVLRLRIQVTHLAGEDGPVTAVLGDARRIGSPNEVPASTTTTTP